MLSVPKALAVSSVVGAIGGLFVYTRTNGGLLGHENHCFLPGLFQSADVVKAENARCAAISAESTRAGLLTFALTSTALFLFLQRHR